MTTTNNYAIRGGVEGRERLRTLSRAMHPYSSALFDRLGLRNGMACLDVGCGGGDATIELGRRVAPDGRAVGVDIDETKLALARDDARSHGVANVEFRRLDFAQAADADQYDVVYARFLLTHLRDPRAAVEALHRHLRPGGLVAVEDIDFSGSFAYPPSKAFARYWELYCAVVDRRGDDPNIGPKLPLLLEACGFDAVDVSIVQPAGMRGDAKLIGPLTMENIADSVIADGLAARDEIDALVRDMYAYVSDPKTITGLPRVVQAWGRRS